MNRQLALNFIEPFLSPEEHWESGDDWETPNRAARAIANLLLPSDKQVLEPAAGTGQIAKFLSKNSEVERVVCYEPNPYRYNLGRRLLNTFWVNTNIEEVTETGQYDLLITNPPFSKIQTFIQHGLTFLNPANPTARLLFLLPIDWMSLRSVEDWWRDTDAHIHHIYAVAGRIAYLKNGIPVSGRQRNDAIFDIRPGRDGAAISYLEV